VWPDRKKFRYVFNASIGCAASKLDFVRHGGQDEGCADTMSAVSHFSITFCGEPFNGSGGNWAACQPKNVVGPMPWRWREGDTKPGKGLQRHVASAAQC